MKIKVYVTRVSNRPNFHLQWVDPIKQQQRRKVTWPALEILIQSV